MIQNRSFFCADNEHHAWLVILLSNNRCHTLRSTLMFKKAPKCQNIPEQSFYTQKHTILYHIIFFHPDCTVGLGITPNHALRLVGYTTGRELHPALKILFS